MHRISDPTRLVQRESPLTAHDFDSPANADVPDGVETVKECLDRYVPRTANGWFHLVNSCINEVALVCISYCTAYFISKSVRHRSMSRKVTPGAYPR